MEQQGKENPTFTDIMTAHSRVFGQSHVVVKRRWSISSRNVAAVNEGNYIQI